VTLFPHPAASGWVYVLNDTEGMQAFWLNYDASLTYLGGSEAAQYDTIGSDQIVPLVAADAELNIINPNFSKIALTIRLFGSEGELASAFMTELQIAGAFQSKVSAMFPSGDTPVKWCFARDCARFVWIAVGFSNGLD
jgi:hypothetical protein